ncbi:hypothetical protein AMAG_12584 [Allomyces macrogynus ATCC 38327]|uniref:CAP-Gly domain-containing protein n=1 Tax=Allomyces macrogynus (strain ATCC 38327) TaxID=578462 RepID=A0A0L0SZE3_ALLM3|nr:hypothetical protein AMAG_12584 [Allomyces macrogynus ATCC 38327]|eukprot:KNE67866.1 hypothetical protein AMAG_12584 [Allomyces macrogynus ATCC 38327]
MIAVHTGGNPIVTLFVQSDNTIASERRFDKGLTIPQLKARLEPITGIMAPSQKILLYSDKTLVGPITGDDNVFLGAFPVADFMTLRVVDLNPAASARNQYNDLSLVEKYEMQDDKYDTLRDTVRDFKRRNKLGRFDDARSSATDDDDAAYEAAAAKISVGDRCQVDVSTTADPNAGTKRGVVKFVGKVDFKPGHWVGVEYDEPVGKHDGAVQGKAYFAARNKHGAFVRPTRVEVGDFPELDPFDELEEM